MDAFFAATANPNYIHIHVALNDQSLLRLLRPARRNNLHALQLCRLYRLLRARLRGETYMVRSGKSRRTHERAVVFSDEAELQLAVYSTGHGVLQSCIRDGEHGSEHGGNTRCENQDHCDDVHADSRAKYGGASQLLCLAEQCSYSQVVQLTRVQQRPGDVSHTLAAEEGFEAFSPSVGQTEHCKPNADSQEDQCIMDSDDYNPRRTEGLDVAVDAKSSRANMDAVHTEGGADRRASSEPQETKISDDELVLTEYCAYTKEEQKGIEREGYSTAPPNSFRKLMTVSNGRDYRRWV